MGRDFKFRQPIHKLDRTFYRFHYWGWLNGISFTSPLTMDSWLKPKESMQYTGIKDKNGVEIYEGDMPNGILNGTYVRWCGVCASFELFDIKHGLGCYGCLGDMHWNEAIKYLSAVEIIGNICENPELLEVEA